MNIQDNWRLPQTLNGPLHFLSHIRCALGSDVRMRQPLLTNITIRSHKLIYDRNHYMYNKWDVYEKLILRNNLSCGVSLHKGILSCVSASLNTTPHHVVLICFNVSTACTFILRSTFVHTRLSGYAGYTCV